MQLLFFHFSAMTMHLTLITNLLSELLQMQTKRKDRTQTQVLANIFLLGQITSLRIWDITRGPCSRLHRASDSFSVKSILELIYFPIIRAKQVSFEEITASCYLTNRESFHRLLHIAMQNTFLSIFFRLHIHTAATTETVLFINRAPFAISMTLNLLLQYLFR